MSDAAQFKIGQAIKVVQKGRVQGVLTVVEFSAVVTYVDDRRAEYEGGGRKGGFALRSPLINNMTSMGGIFTTK